MSAAILLVQSVAVLGGLVICYAALALYENEHRLVQNARETWWIRVDDLQRTALAFHTALIKSASEAGDRLLVRIWGERLVSLRAVAVSVLLAFASAHFIPLVVDDIVLGGVGFGLFFGSYSPLLRTLAVSAIALVVAASVTQRLNYALYVGAVTVTGLPVAIVTRRADTFGEAEGLFLLTPVGIVLDMIGLTLARQLMQWQSRGTTAGRLYIGSVLGVGSAAAIILLPIAVGRFIDATGRDWGELIMWTPFTTGVVALSLLTFFLSLVALLLHRLLWPTVARPLYQLAQLGVFRTRATRSALFVLGSEVVAAGMGHPAVAWDVLRRWFLSA